MGKLDKDTSVIVFTYTKMPAAKVHTAWDAWSKVDNVQSSCNTTLCRLGLCSLVHIAASCFDEMCWQIM